MKLNKAISLLLISLTMILLTSCKQKIINRYYLRYWEAHTYVNQDFEGKLLYRLFKPSNEKKEMLPLVLYLHPWGNGGDDNRRQISGLINEWIKTKSQNEHPCYILAPQCPENKEWVNKGPASFPFDHYTQDDYPEEQEMKLIIKLINSLVKDNTINKNKIYVIGHSMGATGTWDIITRYPDTFTAALISSGVSDTTKASKLKNTPVWAFSGEKDNIAPLSLNKNMTTEINRHGGNAKLTVFSNIGHNMASLAFGYPGVKDWLFSHTSE